MHDVNQIGMLSYHIGGAGAALYSAAEAAKENANGGYTVEKTYTYNVLVMTVGTFASYKVKSVRDVTGSRSKTIQIWNDKSSVKTLNKCWKSCWES